MFTTPASLLFFFLPNSKQTWIWNSLRSTYRACQKISTSKSWVQQVMGSKGEFGHI